MTHSAPTLARPDVEGRRLLNFSPRTRVIIASVAALTLLGSILAANYVTTDFGFIPVGFGLEATAGTLFAGVALACRDLIQDALGRLAVVGVIVLGTIVSFAFAAPGIAWASAAAFLFAELLDFAVYTPIRYRSRLGDKRWAIAVVASDFVGAIADTVIFIGIAFGPAAILTALPGQLLGKMYATVLYLVIGSLLARFAWRAVESRSASLST